MRRLPLLGLLCVLGPGLLGCGTRETDARIAAGDPVETVGDVRFSLPTPHRVVVERRTADGWGQPQVVFEDVGRECGAVHALVAGATVAATVDCDEHYAVDQAPTRSVALVVTDRLGWSHRDLDGEAAGTPGLSPGGGHAVWPQDGGLLTWDGDRFGATSVSPDEAQVVTVDDRGAVVAIGVGMSRGECAVLIDVDGKRSALPVARAGSINCEEVGLALATPSEIRGDVSGQPGTGFVVRHTSADAWRVSSRPALDAPGLERYPDDPARAIWNQVTANTRGDLVAMGSPDRQHITAQRYDGDRRRWTPPEVVHDAGAPVCRRSTGDSGVLQGARFRLRLVCAGTPVVLRSGTGVTWSR
jgi:hypothetical protein